MDQSQLHSISVVIPTCDRPLAFVKDAVNSVLAQSVKPDQIIVVDNGFKPLIASELSEEITVYRMLPRVGPSRARNFGAGMSDGNLLAFLDDDDVWDADFLKNLTFALTDQKADCVYGRIDVLRSGVRSEHVTPSKYDLSTRALVNRASGFGGINFLIKREMFWLAGGFDERLGVSEDRALTIEILRNNGKIAIAPDAVAIMRVHEHVRQRQSDLSRLGFIWKYRSELGFFGFVKRVVSILSKTFRRRRRQLQKRLVSQ